MAQAEAELPLNFDREAAIRAGVSAHILDLAMRAVTCGVASGDLVAPPTLTVIDYSLPSARPRLWVFDLRSGQLLFKELVAHGRNSGVAVAEHFSDEMGSRRSSLGLFRTADTYVGQNGYSLRLDGLEPGFNGQARARAIVMHGADYVDVTVASARGRVGRSWGCPALREAVARQLIDTVRDGSVVFSYYPDPVWLANSRFLRCGSTGPAVFTPS
jgi:L,D-transpeptidase catalytic domain